MAANITAVAKCEICGKRAEITAATEQEINERLKALGYRRVRAKLGQTPGYGDRHDSWYNACARCKRAILRANCYVRN